MSKRNYTSNGFEHMIAVMKEEKYLELSEKYLLEAEDFLAKGDYTQASEKFWGSVAEVIKALAEKRGLEHYRHHHLSIVIEELVKETGDVELGKLYAVAERLHANFYENFASPISIKAYVEDVKSLRDKLKRLYEAELKQRS